jgi:hypothetical protein
MKTLDISYRHKGGNIEIIHHKLETTEAFDNLVTNQLSALITLRCCRNWPRIREETTSYQQLLICYMYFALYLALSMIS